MSEDTQTLSIFEKAGIAIPENLPDNKVETIFEATGLNWKVEQHPVFTSENGIHFNNIKTLTANYRSDNKQFMGMVHPNNYKVVQNNEAFNFIDELPNFSFEKVGLFNNGKKVFVVGKSNEQIDIDGSGDLVNFYLTFLHGHDGKSGIRFILSPVRMFCMNQLNMMLETAKFKYNIAHTGDIQTKLNQIQKAIANSKNYVMDLQTTINNMISTKTTKPIEKFAMELIPEEEKDTTLIISRKEEVRATIISLYNNKDDIQNYKGTNFGIISAVSDYLSHAVPKRISKGTIDNTFINNIEGNILLERARLILTA